MGDRVKINFQLEQDEDGYPPYEWEGIWAEKLEGGNYKIDNIAFYAQDVSVDDVVSASESEQGLVYVRTLKKSLNGTIRVICYTDEGKKDLLSRLPTFGCEYEVGVPTNLVAVNIPTGVDVDALLEYLDEQGSAGAMDYEESAPRYLGES